MNRLPFDQIRTAIGRDLSAAMKAGDRTRMSGLRAALHVLDNATAVAPGTTSAPAPAVEVPRRPLQTADLAQALTAAAGEHAAAAVEYRRLGDTARADRLQREADVIHGCLDHLRGPVPQAGP